MKDIDLRLENTTETGNISPDAHRNPVKAIGAWCLQCSGGSAKERHQCPVKHCPLFPFRLGKNPYRTGRAFSDEERAALARRLKENLARKSSSHAAEQMKLEGI